MLAEYGWARVGEGRLRALGLALREAAQSHGAARLEALFAAPSSGRDAFAGMIGAPALDTLAEAGMANLSGPGEVGVEGPGEGEGAVEPRAALRMVAGKPVFTDRPEAASGGPEDFLDPLWEAPKLTRFLAGGAAERGLDMGCGCGVFALRMADYCREVVAADLNERALEATRFNAALNGAGNIRAVHSNLFEAVAGERFDRIAFNAPVGLEFTAQKPLMSVGDWIIEAFVREAAEAVTPGGYIQMNLCMREWAGDAFFPRLRQWLGAEADQYHAVFIEQHRLEGFQPAFLRLKAMGLAKLGWRALSCRSITRGFLTLRRAAPGEAGGSWRLAANYHLWRDPGESEDMAAYLEALLRNETDPQAEGVWRKIAGPAALASLEPIAA